MPDSAQEYVFLRQSLHQFFANPSPFNKDFFGSRTFLGIRIQKQAFLPAIRDQLLQKFNG